jgi:hypothetical protein
MSNEVAIDLTLNGVGSLKSQLKSLKAAIAEASDPAQMDALAKKAGEVSDRIKDANDAVNVFASGSKFEQISSSFGGIKDSIMSLDFDEASQKAKTFQKVMGGIGKADISTALKGLGKTVMTLGSTFMKLGAQILMNPIFLITAVIVAIVAAIGIFLNKIGVLDKVLATLMYPINLLIQGFKDLTDWLGLTQYAAEENAEKMVEANKKIQESSKDRDAVTSQMYSNQIALLKAQGKDTYKTEVQASMAMSLSAKERYTSAKKALDAQLALGKSADKEKIKELRKQIADEKAIIVQGRSDRQILAINDANEDAAAAAAAAQKAADKRKENAANRLSAERTIIDNRIALVAEESARELQEIQEKYRRQVEDIKKNEKLTAKEKETLTKQSNDLLAKAELDFQAKQTKIAEDAGKERTKKAQEESDKKIAIADAQWLRLQELNAIATKTESEFEKLKLQQKFDEEVAAAGTNGELVKALETQLQKDLNDIDKKAADERVKIKEDEEKKKRDAQFKTANDALSIAEDGVKSIQALGDIAFAAKMKNVKKGSKEEEALAKKQFTFNKSMQLAGAVVDAGKAVTASLAAAPLAIGVVPNPVGIANLVATAAMSAANIAKIASTQFTSTSAPPPPDTGGGGNTSVSSSVPSFTPGNLFGQGNNQNNVESSDSNNITVTAIVSETEITSTQNKVSKIQKSSEL